jgi:hypothetical protein
MTALHQPSRPVSANGGHSQTGGERVKSTDFVEKVACRGDALLIHFSQ